MEQTTIYGLQEMRTHQPSAGTIERYFIGVFVITGQRPSTVN